MDCDAGSSRGEGFRRGDSAPGLPRGVGFGSRAGGSGSLRSPFVDVDSPSLPMVAAAARAARQPVASAACGSTASGGSAARERLSGSAASGERGSAAAWSGAQWLGDAASGAQRPERSAAAGPGGAYRGGAAAVVSGQLFSHDGVGRSCRVSTELSALKAF